MNDWSDDGSVGTLAFRINMAELIRAIELQSEHQEQLLALYRRHFGAWSAERLAQRWDWQCGAGNPWRALRPTSGLVALDNGGVVAGAAMFPVPWRVNGKRLIFLCASDFAIDRPYRRRVLPQLMSGIMSRPHVMGSALHPTLWRMALQMGATLLPMSQSHFALHLRNRGWTCRAVRRRLPPAVGRFVSPATAGRLLASKPVEAVLRRLAQSDGLPRGVSLPAEASAADVRPFERFGDDYDGLWEQARQKFRMTFDKDAEYLNWRYLDCPTFRHPILRGLYRDGKLSGVVVAGAYAVPDVHHRPCGANGEILELITPDASAREIEALLLSACRELDRSEVDRIGASSYDGPVREVLERIGFRPEEDKGFDKLVIFDQAEPGAGRVESTEGVYLTAGDGDMLNAYLM
jgi:hypothetical protein